MKINVADILREIAADQDFEGELILGDITWQEEPLRFKGPLHLSSRTSPGGEVLVLTAEVRGTILLWGDDTPFEFVFLQK